MNLIVCKTYEYFTFDYKLDTIIREKVRKLRTKYLRCCFYHVEWMPTGGKVTRKQIIHTLRTKSGHCNREWMPRDQSLWKKSTWLVHTSDAIVAVQTQLSAISRPGFNETSLIEILRLHLNLEYNAAFFPTPCGMRKLVEDVKMHPNVFCWTINGFVSSGRNVGRSGSDQASDCFRHAGCRAFGFRRLIVPKCFYERCNHFIRRYVVFLQWRISNVWNVWPVYT